MPRTLELTPRAGSCVDHGPSEVDLGFVNVCAHLKWWPEGDLFEENGGKACQECIEGRCDHEKSPGENLAMRHLQSVGQSVLLEVPLDSINVEDVIDR